MAFYISLPVLAVDLGRLEIALGWAGTLNDWGRGVDG